MDLKEVMAINMRRLRYDKKLTQEELAARSGLSMRYVGSIERGTVSASVSVLGKVAEALGVDPGDLIRAQKR
jgi:transcriptional regulator with XRE-family HTH domain